MRPATYLVILGLALAVTLSGCAFGDRHVTLTYPPPQPKSGGMTSVAQAAPPPALPAEKVVLVAFLDQRPNKAMVGAVHNAYGMHTADVIAQNSVGAWVAAGLTAELQRVGFEVSQQDVIPPSSDFPVITGEVLKVYCSAYSTYETEVGLSIRVERDGKTVLQQSYLGETPSLTNWTASESGFGLALSLALESAARSFAADLRRQVPLAGPEP